MSEPVRRNTAEEIIAVVQAWQRGEEIEGAMVGRSGVAFSAIGGSREPDWNFPHVHYRPKPKPREFWINRYGADVKASIVHDSLDSVENGRTQNCLETIHVREVTP